MEELERGLEGERGEHAQHDQRDHEPDAAARDGAPDLPGHEGVGRAARRVRPTLAIARTMKP